MLLKLIAETQPESVSALAQLTHRKQGGLKYQVQQGFTWVQKYNNKNQSVTKALGASSERDWDVLAVLCPRRIKWLQ